MTRRRRIEAALAAARQEITVAEAERDTAVERLAVEVARLEVDCGRRLQAQRDEHAAVQRQHLADLARARQATVDAVHRDLIAERDEAADWAARTNIENYDLRQKLDARDRDVSTAEDLRRATQRRLDEVTASLRETATDLATLRLHADAQTDALIAVTRLARAAAEKVPARTTRRRYLTQVERYEALIGLTPTTPTGETP